MVCKEAGRDVFYEFSGMNGKIQIEEGFKREMGSVDYTIEKV